MSKGQFFELGCPNCRDLEMQENENRVFACTTSNYSGFFSMVNPGAFASRFNGLEKRMPGCYALVVHGKLPDFELGDDDYEPDIDEGEGEQEQAQGSAGFGSSDHHTDAEDFNPYDELLKSPLPSPEGKAPASGRSRRSGEVSPSHSAPKSAEAQPGKRKRLRQAEVSEPSPASASGASSDQRKAAQAPILKDDDSAEFR